MQFVICLNYTEERPDLQQRHQNNCQKDDGCGANNQQNNLFDQRRIQLVGLLIAVDGQHIVIVSIIPIVRRFSWRGWRLHRWNLFGCGRFLRWRALGLLSLLLCLNFFPFPLRLPAVRAKGNGAPRKGSAAIRAILHIVPLLVSEYRRAGRCPVRIFGQYEYNIRRYACHRHCSCHLHCHTYCQAR